jgi:hypothetical protein
MTTLREVTDNITPDMLDRAIGAGTRGSLMTRVAFACSQAPHFSEQVHNAVVGSQMAPLGSAPDREHHIARTALLGGIQIGVMLALMAQEEMR